MKSFRNIALSLLLLLLLSCSKKDTAPRYRYPLSQGNSWTYLLLQNDYSGLDYVDTLYVWVDGTILSPEKELCTALCFRSTMGNRIMGDEIQYVANRADGLYYLGSSSLASGPLSSDKLLHYPLPISGLSADSYRAADENGVLWLRVPHLLMPYRPETGFEWDTAGEPDFAYVRYRMLEKQNIDTDCGRFKSFVKRSRLYLFLDDPDEYADAYAEDYDSENYDYYSKVGLVRFRNEYMSDEHGNIDEAGSLKYYYQELIDYKLK